jgi:hypothetical protein
MKVIIELDANDAKFLLDSSRRFIDASAKYAEEWKAGGHPNATHNLEAWKRIRDAVDSAKTT